MKNTLILLIIAIFSQVSYAGHISCFNSKIYYSNVRNDFGIQPPPGTVLGSTLLVHNAETLIKKTHVANRGSWLESAESYKVAFSKEVEVLEEIGSEVVGERTYKTEMTVLKENGTETIEVAREKVVCNRAWALVP